MAPYKNPVRVSINSAEAVVVAVVTRVGSNPKDTTERGVESFSL